MIYENMIFLFFCGRNGLPKNKLHIFDSQKIYILPQHLHKQFPVLVAQNILVLVVSNDPFMHVQFIQTMN